MSEFKRHNFKKLKIWQMAMELAKEIFKLSSSFPSSEKFGLTSQMNRCSVSMPSNIAEGSSRTNKSFSHFLDISRGSLFEIETQLLITNELGFITNETLYTEILSQIEEESKMINAFSKTLKN